ncbi:MAG: FixH family protein [Vicinamibacterales bacterium]
MTRLISTAIAFTFVALGAASCGRDEDAPPASAPAVGATQPLDITFRTEPDPPKSGETTLEANVKGSNGQPVTDAEVSAEFYMASMPEVKMPEMRNTIALQHEGGGRYRGKGSIMMAGKWDVTVTVKRHGEEVGKRTLTITAQ